MGTVPPSTLGVSEVIPRNTTAPQRGSLHEGHISTSSRVAGEFVAVTGNWTRTVRMETPRQDYTRYEVSHQWKSWDSGFSRRWTLWDSRFSRPWTLWDSRFSRRCITYFSKTETPQSVQWISYVLGGSIPGRRRNICLIHNLQIDTGAHSASYPMDTKKLFPREWSSQGVKLITLLYQQQKLRTREAVTPLPNTSQFFWGGGVLHALA
jgi:hypothetical protein